MEDQRALAGVIEEKILINSCKQQSIAVIRGPKCFNVLLAIEGSYVIIGLESFFSLCIRIAPLARTC